MTKILNTYLGPLSSIFFYCGLCFLILKDKDSRSAILLSWLMLIALVGALSAGAPAVQRYVASAPACALLVGYGLDRTRHMLIELIPKISKVVGVISYFALSTIAIGNLLFYFVEYTSFAKMDEAISTGMIEYQLGVYLRDQPADVQFVVFGQPWLSHDTPTVLYLAPQSHGFNAPEDWAMFDESQLTSHKLILLFLPEYQSEIEPMRERFPGGTLRNLNSNGRTLFWVYELAVK